MKTRRCTAHPVLIPTGWFLLLALVLSQFVLFTTALKPVKHVAFDRAIETYLRNVPSRQQQSSPGRRQTLTYSQQRPASSKATPSQSSREQKAPTLEQIYGPLPKNSSSYVPSNTQNRRETLLWLNYLHDLNKINPRNGDIATLFRWSSNLNQITQVPADNAALVPHPRPNGDKYGGYVDFISLPFDRFFALDDTVNNQYSEGVIVYKKDISCSETQRVLFRQLFGCTTFNVGQHPFPHGLVKKPWNDPRLVSCFFGIDDDFSTYYFALTNKGIWATYNHGAQFDGDLSFQAKRLVGARRRYDEPVDVAIEFNGPTNSITFYVNGYPVWILNSLGLPPPDDGYTKIDLGAGTPHAQRLSTRFTLRTGTGKSLDETDPNNADSNTRLVAFVPLVDPYYGGQNTTFYDPFNTKGNVIFGQGAIGTFYNILVIRQNSLPLHSAGSSRSEPPKVMSSPSRASSSINGEELYSNFVHRRL